LMISMNGNRLLLIMQTIKKNWVYTLFVFAVGFFIYKQFIQKAKHPDQVEISYKVFHTDAGWGYDIFTNDTLYVHQQFMPAIEGRKGFASEADAKLIATLAVTKMKDKKLKLPMILLSDLDSCKIAR